MKDATKGRAVNDTKRNAVLGECPSEAPTVAQWKKMGLRVEWVKVLPNHLQVGLREAFLQPEATVPNFVNGFGFRAHWGDPVAFPIIWHL